LNLSKSKAAFTFDQFYSKFEDMPRKTPLEHLIVSSVADALPTFKKIAYKFTKQGRSSHLQKDHGFITWNDFLQSGKTTIKPYQAHLKGSDPALILYSGGTTAVTKGVVLTNLNINAHAMQIIEMSETFRQGDSVLSIMPMFHAFGLSVGVHSFLTHGGRCILVPRFSDASLARLIKDYRPNFVAAVPSLYEMILRSEDFKSVDMSSFKGVFCGGDSLSVDLKRRIDVFLLSHGAIVEVREGYGTTESVSANCLPPQGRSKSGSIGIPFPDTYFKIVKVGTTLEVPYNQKGEICVAAPTVMAGYLDNPSETDKVLKNHDDGMLWLHTGDIGSMDEEGYIYFAMRLKLMIVTNGYNVYPTVIENILDAHPLIHKSCVVGVADPIKIQKVKAYIVLNADVPKTDAVRESILHYCKEHIARYAIPEALEFLDALPRTLVGKVAYRELEADISQERVLDLH
jgi:long-chain acyl-CoA synthetase